MECILEAIEPRCQSADSKGVYVVLHLPVVLFVSLLQCSLNCFIEFSDMLRAAPALLGSRYHPKKLELRNTNCSACDKEFNSRMEEIAPSRSRTDPAAPEAHRIERPRRLRATSFRPKGQHNTSNHHHHHHSHRQAAKETVQSAIELRPPINFDHLLRRDKKSPDSSRRGSGTPQRQQQLDGSASVRTAPKVVKAEDVAKAKKQNAKREEELRESLKNVEEVGMSSTRQLDDTYYAILEKSSMLRSTVASLQQLADESRRMHKAFQEDTANLEKDTNQNLESFGNFDNQERTINDLVKKLQDSRGRTNTLNDRLESARLRVEAYEERESVKNKRRRYRFHVFWASLVGLILLVIAVLLARNRRAVGHQLSTVGEHLVKLGDVADDIVAPISSRLRPAPSEDPYLSKLFDEL